MQGLRLETAGCSAEVVGEEHGLTAADREAALARGAEALDTVRSEFEAGGHRFLRLADERIQWAEIREAAASIEGRCSDFVVCGIGGSALGNQALDIALRGGAADGSPRLHILDNIDPERLALALDTLDPETTWAVVTSKSGSTAETMAEYLILGAWLGEDLVAEHLWVTTDAAAGPLRAEAARLGLRSFEVPDGVGGRFSVLTPVGLVSAAVCGLDVEGLLDGASAASAACVSLAAEDNPAVLHAALHHALDTDKGKSIHVQFAYADALLGLGDWYRQLLAESIGKQGHGPTPVKALGPTDQHSQVQLYVEGPHDKVFTFLTASTFRSKVPIPESDLDAASYLGGRDLADLLHAERRGTQVALLDAGRPQMEIVFDAVTAPNVGSYLIWMETSIALMGQLYGVNAFDQPGVEAGKIAAFALMERDGYADRRAEIEARGARLRD